LEESIVAATTEKYHQQAALNQRFSDRRTREGGSGGVEASRGDRLVVGPGKNPLLTPDGRATVTTLLRKPPELVTLDDLEFLLGAIRHGK
jgi:hypothetical protein